MRFRFPAIAIGLLLFFSSCSFIQAPSASANVGLSNGARTVIYNPLAISKNTNKKIYVHIMPWFESPATSGNGSWGIHWTMANQNPNTIDASGRRQIASFYYPLTGPYGSSDKDIIEYQLLLMKYAGVDGILVDWPGTLNAMDYPKNRANAEAIISKAAAVGLSYAVVYEDNNLALANVANKIAQAQSDMNYLQSNYFNQANYIKMNGAPLLLDFGPQALTNGSDWNSVFSVLGTKPCFLPLWYQQAQGGSSAQGEFAWIYSDYTAGLSNFYNNHPLNVKFGVAYPGFNTFYNAGGWGGPTWSIPVGNSTFATTLNLALGSSTSAIQLATWNDFGEGTMIEPTREFGYSFLNIMQSSLGLTYGQHELDLIAKLYAQRKQYAGNASLQGQLDQAFYYLVSLQTANAEAILNGSTPSPAPSVAPSPTPVASVTPSPSGQVSYYLQNAWQKTYAYDNAGKLAYASTANGNSYKWVLESVNGFTRIKNLASGNYINIEGLLAYAEVSTVPSTYYSGYWTQESINGYIRLKNAWQGSYLNIENLSGFVQCSNVPSNYSSSYWTLIQN